ncbi:MAG: hypothetical protein IPH77_12850 [Ignavibacteria bacterium]|nr:hypothetical protein [Ignavibacteria bacterium]
MTLKRQSRGDVIIVYDSTIALCRTSRDSVINNLSNMGATFDTYNRNGNTGTASISFRGYKKVILLGEGTSIMSNVVKDSIKSYLASGGNTVPTKSKLIIIGEDVGYHLDRTGSTYIDSAFARSTLGFQFMADRPGVAANGLTGVIINPGLTDSTIGTWPDVLKISFGTVFTDIQSLQVQIVCRFNERSRKDRNKFQRGSYGSRSGIC